MPSSHSQELLEPSPSCHSGSSRTSFCLGSAGLETATRPRKFRILIAPAKVRVRCPNQKLRVCLSTTSWTERNLEMSFAREKRRSASSKKEWPRISPQTSKRCTSKALRDSAKIPESRGPLTIWWRQSGEIRERRMLRSRLLLPAAPREALVNSTRRLSTS